MTDGLLVVSEIEDLVGLTLAEEPLLQFQRQSLDPAEIRQKARSHGLIPRVVLCHKSAWPFRNLAVRANAYLSVSVHTHATPSSSPETKVS